MANVKGFLNVRIVEPETEPTETPQVPVGEEAPVSAEALADTAA